ncbi:MAG: RNA polymerase sigma factor [Fimbriimonadaceae bacterium]
MGHRKSETRSLHVDCSLVARAQRGDTVAMSGIVEALRPVVYSHAFRMLRNSDDAHDVCQETFLKAFTGLRNFDPERPLLPWILKICRNCCIDAVRARKRGPDTDEAMENRADERATNVHDAVADTLRDEELTSAIDRLPGRYREIMTMRHVHSMEINEIADRLHRPEGTVKSWLFRARALLRKDLSPAMV